MPMPLTLRYASMLFAVAGYYSSLCLRLRRMPIRYVDDKVVDIHDATRQVTDRAILLMPCYILIATSVM